MSDHLNLNWNSHEANLGASLKELREGNDFFDVTLACEDEQIQCHKLILSACSPVMLKILRHNLHPHPLLYLKGIKFKHLLSVLDFMYDGQVNVSQEDLMSFMATAEEFKVKGLTKSHKCNSEEVGPTVTQDLNDLEERDTTILCPRIDDFTSNNINTSNLDEFTFSPIENSVATKKSSVSSESTRPSRIYPQNPFSLPSLESVLASPGESFGYRSNQGRLISDQDTYVAKPDNDNILEMDQGNSNDYKESSKSITEKCNSMITKKQEGYFHCLRCNFKNVNRRALIRHVENHLMLHLVCDMCNKSFKNRNSLYSHKNLNHKVFKVKDPTSNNNLKDHVNSSLISDVAGSSQTPKMAGPSGSENNRVSDGVSPNNNTEHISCGIVEENEVSLDNIKKINVKVHIEHEDDGIAIVKNLDGLREKEVSEDRVAKLYGEPEDYCTRSIGVDLSPSEDDEEYLES